MLELPQYYTSPNPYFRLASPPRGPSHPLASSWLTDRGPPILFHRRVLFARPTGEQPSSVPVTHFRHVKCCCFPGSRVVSLCMFYSVLFWQPPPNSINITNVSGTHMTSVITSRKMASAFKLIRRLMQVNSYEYHHPPSQHPRMPKSTPPPRVNC
ncbi:hypothetical protein F4824DRAFT_471665 [Ustulina deusta]|nr:hypothetical protein F4824DRAFT_471665 [Ustulina deusta]